MSIINKKKEVFSKIAAARTLTDKMPGFKPSSSFSSVNNSGDITSFLIDLIQSLVGFEPLVETVVEIITYSLPKVEKNIKKVLKDELKTIVNCGIDPKIPFWFQSTGNGITIEIKKLDFIDVIRTNPNTIQGKLIYKDVTPILTESSDFNTFLFGVIQDDGITHTWNGMFDITFNSIGMNGVPNNTLNIKTNSNYDNKTLTDLNNNYIDSINLFDSSKLLTQIIDIIYGTLSSSIGKSLKQLESEARLNSIIDKFVNNMNQTNLTDNVFEFTREEIYTQQLTASFRKQGVRKINVPKQSYTSKNVSSINKDSNEINASIELNSLYEANNNIEATTNSLSKKISVISAINQMSYETTKNVPNSTDNITVKFDFIKEIINNINKAIVNKILFPNVIFLFAVNYKIVNGVDADYENSVDFLKKNKNLINRIIKKVLTEITSILTMFALKHIQQLVARKIAKKIREKQTLNTAQILSLTGVPKNQIRNLTNNL